MKCLIFETLTLLVGLGIFAYIVVQASGCAGNLACIESFNPITALAIVAALMVAFSWVKITSRRNY